MNLNHLMDRWPIESRNIAITLILVAALIGFEIFNYDTTRFALLNLFGTQAFLGLAWWASILAFAFCGIDFAGLIRMFTPEQGRNEPIEVWLLTAAWLLGATLNAIMTWYAATLAMTAQPLGNEILSREQIITYGPIFIAFLVWLTRILFIGSISVAGDRLLHAGSSSQRNKRRKSRRSPRRDPHWRSSNYSQRNQRDANGQAAENEDFEADFFNEDEF